MTFLWLALLAGLGVALLAAPLGAFMVWQRLAYFGDTLAHSALLGVAFSLLLAVNTQLAIGFACLLVALLLTLWQRHQSLATDTLLGIISHSSLALGLILVSLFDQGRLDLSSYLLGDILSTTATEVIVIWCVALASGLLIWRYWQPLLAVTIDPAMAQVEGVPVTRMRLLLLVLLALAIAVAIKIVGVLLITALLIIPAAAASFRSASPELMVVLAAVFGCCAVGLGLALSFYVDTPAGPSIVAAASGIFVVAFGFRKKSTQ